MGGKGSIAARSFLSKKKNEDDVEKRGGKNSWSKGKKENCQTSSSLLSFVSVGCFLFSLLNAPSQMALRERSTEAFVFNKDDGRNHRRSLEDNSVNVVNVDVVVVVERCHFPCSFLEKKR